MSPQNAAVLKPYEKANRNFVAVATVLHQLGKTKTSLLFEQNSVGNQTVSRKQNNGTFVQVSTVPAAISYHQNMGGVDLDDQLCQGPQVSKVVAIFALVASRC